MPTYYTVSFALALLLIGAALFAGAVLLWVDSEKRAYREPRRIICPENVAHASVVVDGRRAALTMLEGHEEYAIADCSRWPKRAGCDQACSLQVPFVADDRTKGEYAPFGLTPRQLRIHNPVRMSANLFGRIMRQEAERHASDTGA